jgi:predicted metal-dependent phosphotriesterase family hydrolase
MALTQTEKKEIETIARKEIKDFLQANTMNQFEDKLIDMMVKEIKRGKPGTEIRDIVVKIFSEFYQFMWMQRSYWEPRLKNVR